MPFHEDALQDAQDISHLSKLFKVIEAVTEAVNDGIDPQRIQKAIHFVLGTKRALSAGKTRQFDTDQHLFNVAAASAATECPKASSFIRGLPYFDSDLDLTNEFLEAAGQHKIKWQDERQQRATHRAIARNAKLAYDERRVLPSSDFAAIDKDLDDAMISLIGNFDQVTRGQKLFARPRVQSGGHDEWVTLNNKPALRAMREEEQKLIKQEKDGAFENIATALQRTHVKEFAYKDDVVDGENVQGDVSEAETASSPLQPQTDPDAKKPAAIVDEKVTDKKAKNRKATANSKKTTTAVKKSTAFGTTTTACSKVPNKPLVKRRGGRPVGYRKQANGKFAFEDGSTVQSKTQSSSNDGGGKKRKATGEAAAIGSSNGKRQHKGKGKGKGEGKDNEAAVNEEAVGEEKEGKGGRSLD